MPEPSEHLHVHDIGHQDGIDYLLMEVEGETLARRLEKGPLSIGQVLKYGPQIADATGYGAPCRNHSSRPEAE